MTNWTLLPDEDIEDEDPEAPEDDESEDEAEGSEDDAGEDEDSDDESEDEDPSFEEFTRDFAATKELVDDLRRSVGRAQALMEQYRQGNEEVRAEQKAQNANMATLLGAIVNGIDDSVIDPDLKRKIREAQDEIAEAEREERTTARVREELGIDPRQIQAQREVALLQQTANELSADLEDEMETLGLDPDEMDWQGVKAALLSGGVVAAKRFARTKIRAALEERNVGARVTTRKRAAGPTPKGGAAEPPKNELAANDFATKKAALDKLLS